MTPLLSAVQFLAQEGGGEEEPQGIDLLLPESSELIAGILAFAIIGFFVWRWALPAMNRILENRRQAITGQLEDAERAKQEADSLLTDYQQQLAGARDEANRLIDEARQTADSLRADIVAKAEADADSIRRKADEDAAAERARVEADVKREVAGLSMDVAERVIGSQIDRKAQAELVDQYIAELETMNGESST